MRNYFFIIISCFIFQKNCADMIEDMAVMMGAQVGASAANQAVNSQFSDMQKALTHDQTNITSAMNNFSSAVQAAQKKRLDNVFNLFSKAQNNVSNMLMAQQDDMKSMDAYLQAALSRQQPRAEYLVTPTEFDQYFTQGTMYTPQGHIWKNPFPVGNWEYDENSDSFWQMSNVAVEQKAFNNSIFTEWFSRSESYEIACDITLYKFSYPFFVGIIFNKARWISGDQSRLQKYRLLGLYADVNQNINLCFSEAVQTAVATASTAATWNYPLPEIMSGAGVLKTKNLQNILQNIQQYPVLVHIKIKNSATSIGYKFWLATEKEPTNYTMIKSKNIDLYLYHGIGFMAPGAVCEFKLLQPTDLLFSSAAQINFKGDVKALVQKQETQNFAKNIDALAGVAS